MRNTLFAAVAFYLGFFSNSCLADDRQTTAAVPGNMRGEKEEKPRLETEQQSRFRLPSGLPSAKSSGAREPLSGTASFSAGLTTKDYDAGLKALRLRLYKSAEQRLQKALVNLSKNRGNGRLVTLCRLGLAECYLADDNLERARIMLEESRGSVFSEFGAESAEAARFYEDFCRLQLAQGRDKAALDSAHAFLRIEEKRGASSLNLARAQCLMGRVLYDDAYYDDARDYYKKALKVLELETAGDRLDYAEALSGLAQVEKKLGNESESAEMMKRSFEIMDGAVSLAQSPDQRGLVKYEWIEGLYGSRQIVDPSYPLKYLVVDGLRVAVTVVRSYKHVGVLISLANCNSHPLQVAVGPVVVEKLSPGRKKMEFCDPGLIDEVLEEEVILSKTWRRRILCHIQKSRRIPGYLKNNKLDADDFFGNNQFGLYGAWDSTLRDAPPIVTREQFFYDDKPKGSDQEILGFMRGNAAVHPTFIEPGGARTGLVFFLRERYENARVKISIGNAVLSFPFHAVAGQ